jgi:hypothetical protein
MKSVSSSPTLIGGGNTAAPHWGAPFAITEQIGRNGPTMGAPNLTGNAPRLAILEKITPPNVNATKGIANAQSRVRTRVVTASNRAVRRTRGYINSLLMRRRGGTTPRFFQRISTPLISK